MVTLRFWKLTLIFEMNVSGAYGVFARILNNFSLLGSLIFNCRAICDVSVLRWQQKSSVLVP